MLTFVVRSFPGRFVDKGAIEGRERSRSSCLEFDKVRMGLLLFFQLTDNDLLEKDKVAFGKG